MDNRRSVLTGIALVLVVLLVACAPPTPVPPPAEGGILLDSEWALTSLAGAPPIEGTQITLRFGEESVAGSAGCNTYGGGYTATGDSLRLSDLYWTEIGCMEPEGILDQEMAYLNALSTVAGYRVDGGRLLLYDEAGTEIVAFGTQDSGLLATIEAEESFPAGGALNVTFTLTNASSEGLFVLKWFTPLEGLAGNIFSVQLEGENLPYRGKMVKRGSPSSESYVWIDAGESVSAAVDLAEGYDFSQSGQYTIQFLSPRQSHIAKTSGDQATSFDELEMIRIPSQPLNVNIEGP